VTRADWFVSAARVTRADWFISAARVTRADWFISAARVTRADYRGRGDDKTRNRIPRRPRSG
jgi:hypothetical protein